MRRVALIVAGTLAVFAVIAQMAVADWAARKAGQPLTHKQVLHIALVEASRSKDPRPKRIEMATGSLQAATSVTDPTSGLGPARPGKELVDLVVMHGYFHINGSPPRGRQIEPGKVMELIIDAHTGFVEGRSLGNTVPVPLSRLGQVTRLR